MKKILKFFRNIVILVILLLIVAVVLRNYIVIQLAPPIVRATLGVPVSIEGAHISLTKSFIDLDGLEAGNPPGFPEENMLTMPDIYLDYNISSFFKDTLHLEELRVDVASVTVIQEKDGKVNVLALLPPKKDDKDTPEKPVKKRDLQIDLLKLKIGSITFKDYTGTGEPIVKTIRVDIDEEHENITNLEYIGTLIATKVLFNSTINGLLDINVSSLFDEIDVNSILSNNKGISDSLSEQGAKLLDTVSKAAASNDVNDVLQDAAKELKKLF
jgi:uncharacterized protein involved in outer membrane biogenesis